MSVLLYRRLSPVMLCHRLSRSLDVFGRPHSYVAAVRMIALKLKFCVIIARYCRPRLDIVELLLLDRLGPSFLLHIHEVFPIPRKAESILTDPLDRDLIVFSLKVLGEAFSCEQILGIFAIEASYKPLIACTHVFIFI